MKKILTLLLTTSSLFAMNEMEVQRPARSLNQIGSEIFDHKLLRIKHMYSYLSCVQNTKLDVPMGNLDSQIHYMNDFICYFNTVICSEASNLFCELYGKRNSRGIMYTDSMKQVKVGEYIEDLVKQFTELNYIDETRSDKLQNSFILSIDTNGTYYTTAN